MGETFGTLLARHRTDAGLTRTALADLADCHQTYVGQLERGVKEPSRVAVMALASVLDLSQSDTDRLLFSARHAPQTDYQRFWEAEHGAIDDRKKWCPRCEKDLPIKQFARDRRRMDDRYQICKACFKRSRRKAWTLNALRGRARRAS